MKINKLSALGGLAGLILVISSWIRYYIIYHDLSSLLAFGLIGLIIMAGSYIWNELVKTKITLLSVEEYLAAESRGGKTHD